MKRTERNARTPQELTLDQGVETRFGTARGIVEMLIKASAHVLQDLDESPMHAFDAITTRKDHFHGPKYLYLDAINNCFKLQDKGICSHRSGRHQPM